MLQPAISYGGGADAEQSTYLNLILIKYAKWTNLLMLTWPRRMYLQTDAWSWLLWLLRSSLQLYLTKWAKKLLLHDSRPIYISSLGKNYRLITKSRGVWCALLLLLSNLHLPPQRLPDELPVSFVPYLTFPLMFMFMKLCGYTKMFNLNVIFLVYI